MAPFLANAEIEEIVAWIDAGMPEGPLGRYYRGRMRWRGSFCVRCVSTR